MHLSRVNVHSIQYGTESIGNIKTKIWNLAPVHIKDLKVVSATFWLVSFLSVNERTYQTRKSVFYFTSKTLSVLEKIKF